MQSKKYLIFWDVKGDPETLENLLKVHADIKISLGNLISPSNIDDEKIRDSVYCLAQAQDYGFHILKGENEATCINQVTFPYPPMQEKLRNLPSKKELDHLVFLHHLPVPTTTDDNKLTLAKLRKISKPIDRLTNEELADLYGKHIAKNIENLQCSYPKSEIFFTGDRGECALWQRSINRAIPQSIHNFIGESIGSSSEIDLSKFSGCIISPGCATEGYYCILTMPDKNLTLHST